MPPHMLFDELESEVVLSLGPRHMRPQLARKPSPRRPAEWLRARLEELPDLFWIAGLGILQILVLSRFLPRSEIGEWRQYLAMAGIFPAAVLAIAVAPRQWPVSQAWFNRLRIALSVAGVALAFYFVRHSITWLVVGTAVAQLAIMLAVSRCELGSAATVHNPTWWWNGGVALGVLIPCWAAASRLTWWTPFAAWVASSLIEKGLFAAMVILVPIVIFRSSGRCSERANRSMFSVANLLPILPLAFISLRADPAGFVSTYHHLSAIVGPAELVRQGGWLLWDVPSQYGVLNTLLVAWLPFESTWQSFYVLHAMLLLAASYALFQFLRQSGSGLLNYTFSLFVSIVAVHICWSQDCLGPQIGPSVGPFRFGWIYAFAGLLFWESRLCYARDYRWSPIWVGTALWLLSTLWSVESAIYCTVMWMPAYCGMLFRRLSATADPRSLRERALSCAYLLMVPAALFAGMIAALFGYYFIHLGHGPDWHGFADHAMAFKNGFGSLPIDPRGAVTILLAVSFGIAALMAGLVRRSANLGVICMVAATWAGCWAAASYFISRSHENNVSNLIPILCVGIAVVLYVIRRQDFSESTRQLLRVVFVPLLTVIPVIPFANHAAVSQALSAWSVGYNSQFAEIFLPDDAEVAELRVAARLDPNEPLVSMPNASGYLLMPPAITEEGRSRKIAPAWLPVYPSIVLQPLAESRRSVYIHRFIERRPSDGWLLLPKEVPVEAHEWVLRPLQDKYRQTDIHESEHWRLIHFKRNLSQGGESPEVYSSLSE